MAESAKQTGIKRSKTPAKTADAKTEISKGTIQIPLYNAEAKVEKNIDLQKDIFAEEENPSLIAQYVRVYMANQRQGSASTKLRSEVIGSTRKIYRQKGTGNARHGSKKAPIFVGGGVTFGPKPRDFSLKMNSKQKRKALFSALSMRVKEGAISGFVNEILDVGIKTKTMSNLLKSLNFQDQKVLVVIPKGEKNGFVLSLRNIPGVEVVSASTINPYQVLANKSILFVESALEVLYGHFIKQNAN